MKLFARFGGVAAKLVQAHLQPVANRYVMAYPAHGERQDDPHWRDFERIHRTERPTARCQYGLDTGDFSECRDDHGRPAPPPERGLQPALELHHLWVEFSLTNAASLARIRRRFPGVVDVGSFVESTANLVWYCAWHHRGAGGVHHASSSDFAASHFVPHLISAPTRRQAVAAHLVRLTRSIRRKDLA